MPARAVAHLLLESHQQDRQKGRRSTSSISGGAPASPATKEAGGGQMASAGGAGVQSTRRRSLYEYYERIMCTYIGSCEVPSSLGMELINEAVARLSKNMDSWQEVGVDITTSSVTICNLKVGVL